MSWRNVISPPQTLATKLAICIFVLLVGSSVVSFLAACWSFHQRLTEIVDSQLAQGLPAYRRAYTESGLDAVKEELLRNLAWEHSDQAFFRILDESGRELAASDTGKWEFVTRHTTVPDLHATDTPTFAVIVPPSSGSQIRIMYARLGPGAILQRGELFENLEIMKGISTQLLASLSLLVFLGVISSLVLAWKSMSGVRAVTHTAMAIANGDFTQRVNIRGRGTEVDKLADTFDHMLDQIEALLRSLKEVTDDIAHDLRSPITLIRGLAERFAMAAIPAEEARDISGTIVEGCDKLLNLINTMLDISEMNAGAANLDTEDFDATAMVRDIGEIFQPFAEDSGLSLETRLCPPVVFRGDKAKLHRTLANLVDNAIKYTPRGGHIRVSVKTENDRLVIAIEDDGIGIAETDQSRIFERFYRPDHSRTQPGSGLGLSLSRAIVKVHGGTISVQSTPGNGSCFTITLPLNKHSLH